MKISTKPPSGFRDFLPQEMRKREEVIGLIKQVYESYGFEPLETPTMENLSTLMGKYGEEGDQLLFKVLKRGKKLTKALALEDPQDTDLATEGLRYDLTVPLARVYAQYQNDLPRFFKRYQIAPVWRADRPQKGRFREFYQCDVDIIGTTSLTAEAEVVSALAEILNKLGFEDTRIHTNHRALLRAIIQAAGIPLELETETLIALDKLDKIGLDGVVQEFEQRGIPQEGIETLLPMLEIKTQGARGSYTNEATLDALEEVVGELEDGQRALSELRTLLRYVQQGPAADSFFLDPYLARGLSYYTGAIFEIHSDAFRGSLGGGGRYDGLIGMFSKNQVPACGFSLGIERILVLLEERNHFEGRKPNAEVLVALWNEETTPESVKVAHELRAAGYRTELYAQTDKLRKQFQYANARDIALVVLLGESEIAANTVSVKNMNTGEQTTVNRDELVSQVEATLTNT